MSETTGNVMDEQQAVEQVSKIKSINQRGWV